MCLHNYIAYIFVLTLFSFEHNALYSSVFRVVYRIWFNDQTMNQKNWQPITKTNWKSLNKSWTNKGSLKKKKRKKKETLVTCGQLYACKGTRSTCRVPRGGTNGYSQHKLLGQLAVLVLAFCLDELCILLCVHLSYTLREL